MSRARQRENTRIKNREIKAGLRSKEEKIDSFNFYGIHDPTPYEAVKNMIHRGESAADCRATT